MPREEEGDPMIIVGRNNAALRAQDYVVKGRTLAQLRAEYKEVRHLDTHNVECVHGVHGWWHYFTKSGRYWFRLG